MRSFDHRNGDAGDYGDAEETVAMVDGVVVAELPSLARRYDQKRTVRSQDHHQLNTYLLQSDTTLRDCGEIVIVFRG